VPPVASVAVPFEMAELLRPTQSEHDRNELLCDLLVRMPPRRKLREEASQDRHALLVCVPQFVLGRGGEGHITALRSFETGSQQIADRTQSLLTILVCYKTRRRSYRVLTAAHALG